MERVFHHITIPKNEIGELLYKLIGKEYDMRNNKSA